MPVESFVGGVSRGWGDEGVRGRFLVDSQFSTIFHKKNL